jgi:hypothetical protein
MADRALQVLSDETLAASVGKAAAKSVSQRFCVDKVVPLYEGLYKRVSI